MQKEVRTVHWEGAQRERPGHVYCCAGVLCGFERVSLEVCFGRRTVVAENAVVGVICSLFVAFVIFIRSITPKPVFHLRAACRISIAMFRRDATRQRPPPHLPGLWHLHWLCLCRLLVLQSAPPRPWMRTRHAQRRQRWRAWSSSPAIISPTAGLRAGGCRSLR